MAYCGPRGIPHSHFLGGPDHWTELDRHKALAWQAQQARIHTACGTDPDEWDPDKGGDRRAWVFKAAICPGCEQLEQAQERMGHDRMPGEHVVRVRP